MAFSGAGMAGLFLYERRRPVKPKSIWTLIICLYYCYIVVARFSFIFVQRIGRSLIRIIAIIIWSNLDLTLLKRYTYC